MKFIITAFISFFFLASPDLCAQDNVVEDTIMVKGICGMCKTRIEEAAYGKGVKYATWDQVTDLLVIAYRSDKTSRKEIEERILASGHNADSREASSEAYNSLPDCCRYHELEDH